MTVRGVIVAAGYGSRFLPVTRVVPKELLPLVDRPCLDVVVSEFLEAGLRDILVITSRRKKALDDWFDRDPELEAAFRADGAEHKLAKAHPPDVRVQFVRQQHMRGTGHALLLARDFVGDDPFVVAFPDDLFGEPNCTAQILQTHARTGGCVLSAADLSGEDVSRYGVLDLVPGTDPLQVRRVVEKPAPGTEPSSLISLGRYLYTPALFDELARGLAEHDRGEFYPMDAIETLAGRGEVFARVVDAPRHDTGQPLGYLKTVVAFALQHSEVGEPFRRFLLDTADEIR